LKISSLLMIKTDYIIGKKRKKKEKIRGSEPDLNLRPLVLNLFKALARPII